MDSVKVVVIPFMLLRLPFTLFVTEDSTQISVRVSPQGTYLYDWQPTNHYRWFQRSHAWVNPMVNTFIRQR